MINNKAELKIKRILADLLPAEWDEKGKLIPPEDCSNYHRVDPAYRSILDALDLQHFCCKEGLLRLYYSMKDKTFGKGLKIEKGFSQNLYKILIQLIRTMQQKSNLKITYKTTRGYTSYPEEKGWIESISFEDEL